MQLTLNEKRLLMVLAAANTGTPEELGEKLERSPEAVIQYAGLLSEKNLATTVRSATVSLVPTDEGKQYLDAGLPERQVYNSFSGSISVSDLNKHPLAKIGIGWMKRLGWVSIENGLVIKTGDAPESPIESGLRQPASVSPDIKKELIKRGLFIENEVISYLISITEDGKRFAHAGLDLTEETGTLTSDQISSGAWKDLSLRRYDISKKPRPVYPGKIHPYQRLIDEMRNIFLQMGFTELYGPVVQSSFWNFDALFQPQDHPAREMQDTFHLAGRSEIPHGWEAIRDIHEHGGNTSSTGWGGRWDPEKARSTVLRTHTTSLTIRHLAENPKPPQKLFCVGRAYRRETIDSTHLPEFEQLEGIVMDDGLTFRHLLGYLREFYHRMGFEEVRFRPGYFPYTEPSVEPEVYIEGLGWVELGGAGIFREEVTAPWGITCPVLAWGLGASRVAMLKMALNDIRGLCQSDIDWVRKTPVTTGGRY